MVPASILTFSLLATIGSVAVQAWSDSNPPPLVEPTESDWAAIPFNEAAWQYACGHLKRVGSVCLDAKNGDPKLFSVTKTSVQNTVFSGAGHYLHAYCPNLDKKEKPYTIMYGFQEEAVTYRILGRKANEQCCQTQRVGKHLELSPAECIEPAVISADVFPSKGD